MLLCTTFVNAFYSEYMYNYYFLILLSIHVLHDLSSMSLFCNFVTVNKDTYIHYPIKTWQPDFASAFILLCKEKDI